MDTAALQTSMVESCESLVRMESPSSDLTACHQIAESMVDMATQWLDTPARLVSSGDRAMVRWGPDQPRVLLLGHLDTVWPIGTLDQMPWRIEGDRMLGPGVFDMKAGIVIALAAMQSLREERADVGLLLTTDEEIGSPDSRAAIDQACAHAEAALVFEPSADGAFKTRRKGTSWYRVTFRGRAAHAGLEPEAGINALLEAALFATDAATWGNPRQGTTVTPTLLQAGTTANTVPDEAQLTLDVRAWNRDEQERVDEVVRAWRLWHGEAQFDVAGGIDRQALEQESSAALFALAQECARAEGLPEPTEAAVGGASDGNLTAAAGVPTLDGMGAAGGGAHAPHEWAAISELVPRAQLTAAVIRRLVG
jgi:glutamate carboxypeptidase